MSSEQLHRQCMDDNPKIIIRRFPNDTHIYHICKDCSLKPEWIEMNQIDRQEENLQS
ncbi:MAG: hypothetical protein ACE5RJ_05780 [Nitrosopumilaceae archaeon]